MNHETHERHETVYQACLVKELFKRDIPFEAHTINHLNASGMKLGLVVSFGSYQKAAIARLALQLLKD